MARIKIDVHANARDAAAALGSLRDVGLNPGDVGSVWKAEGPVAEVPVHEILAEGLGVLHVTGWIAEAALKAAETESEVDLGQALRAAGIDDKDITRAWDALVGGGGVVGVRARDSLGS